MHMISVCVGRPTEVELCAKASYSNGSPSEELLKRWGNNMRVCELVALLDKLRLERCLLRLRDPGNCSQLF
jgi:hypothetical protein